MKSDSENYNAFWKICGIISLTVSGFTIVKQDFTGAGVLLLCSLFCFVISLPDRKIIVSGRILSPFFRKNNDCYFWSLIPPGFFGNYKIVLIHLKGVTENITDQIEKIIPQTEYKLKFEIEGKIVLRFKIPPSLPIEKPFYENEKDFEKIIKSWDEHLKESIQFFNLGEKTILSIDGKLISFYSKNKKYE